MIHFIEIFYLVLSVAWMICFILSGIANGGDVGEPFFWFVVIVLGFLWPLWTVHLVSREIWFVLKDLRR